MKKNYEIALDMVDLEKIKSPYNCTANPLKMSEDDFLSYIREASELLIKGTDNMPMEWKKKYRSRFLKGAERLQIERNRIEFEKMLGWEVQ